MAISDLPEAGDGIPQPIYDQQTTNITALVLTNNAIENKLCGDLTESVANLSYARNAFNVNDEEIRRVRDHVRDTPTSLAMTPEYKANLLAGLDSMLNFKNVMNGAISQVNRFTDHSNVMTTNIAAVGGVINDVISMPSQLTSDIVGGLPSSFPAKIPSFKLGPDKLPIPNFSGLSLPAIPKFGIASASIPGVPDVKNLPGVSIPGIPNPSDVLKSFGGSALGTQFGGVGKLLSSNMKQFSGVAKALSGGVSSQIASISSGIESSLASQLQGSLTPPVLPSLPPVDQLSDISDLGAATGAVSGLSGGMSNVIGGENGAMNGATCSVLSPGAACGGAPSISNALGTANGLSNMAKTQSSAKLLASTATPALAKQFPDSLIS